MVIYAIYLTAKLGTAGEINTKIGEAYVYIANILAGLIGGIVAVGFGQAPPPNTRGGASTAVGAAAAGAAGAAVGGATGAAAAGPAGGAAGAVIGGAAGAAAGAAARSQALYLVAL